MYIWGEGTRVLWLSGRQWGLPVSIALSQPHVVSVWATSVYLSRRYVAHTCGDLLVQLARRQGSCPCYHGNGFPCWVMRAAGDSVPTSWEKSRIIRSKAKTRLALNVVSLLGQRRRRWPNSETTLGQRLVSARGWCTEGRLGIILLCRRR